MGASGALLAALGRLLARPKWSWVALGPAQVAPGWFLGGPGSVPGLTGVARSSEASETPYLFIVYIYIYIYIGSHARTAKYTARVRGDMRSI